MWPRTCYSWDLGFAQDGTNTGTCYRFVQCKTSAKLTSSLRQKSDKSRFPQHPIFSSSDVEWHLDQPHPIKRKNWRSQYSRDNPIVASFYHFLTASWATKKPHQPTTWRSSGVLVSGGGRAKDMIDIKIEEDEDKRMRSWKTKRRSRWSARTLTKRFSMALLYK